MKLARMWGFENISLSPFYFNSTRLKYALSAIFGVRGKVLEIGGGAGAFTRAIKHVRPDLFIVSTDFDPKLIDLAKKIDPSGNYKKADATRLPFSSKSFDAVISFDVIEHLETPQKAFSESCRILKPKGVLHFAIPLEGSLYTIHGVMSRLWLKPKEKYAGHINHFTREDIESMLKGAGFNHINYKYSGHLMYQIADFIYFLFLSIIRKNPHSTIEGYVESLPKGIKKGILIMLRSVMSFVFYVESVLLKSVPGQIGHFTARKK
jgi:ubiquinone/menaquinone biosynthesis C-methylase UbiE